MITCKSSLERAFPTKKRVGYEIVSYKKGLNARRAKKEKKKKKTYGDGQG
jgi:hypothetical protein